MSPLWVTLPLTFVAATSVGMFVDAVTRRSSRTEPAAGNLSAAAWLAALAVMSVVAFRHAGVI